MIRQFDKGLCLEVTDRERFIERLKELLNKFELFKDTWEGNNPPDKIFVNLYHNSGDCPYYTLVNQHRNGRYTETDISESVLEKLVEENILQDTGETNLYVVENVS